MALDLRSTQRANAKTLIFQNDLKTQAGQNAYHHVSHALDEDPKTNHIHSRRNTMHLFEILWSVFSCLFLFPIFLLVFRFRVSFKISSVQLLMLARSSFCQSKSRELTSACQTLQFPQSWPCTFFHNAAILLLAIQFSLSTDSITTPHPLRSLSFLLPSQQSRAAFRTDCCPGLCLS